MRYACLVYVDEAKLEALTDPERNRLRRESAVCEDDLRRSGHILSAASLQPVRAATTVRVRDGRPLTLDGPASRTDEQLTRILLIEARDLNDALRLAAKLPAGSLGSIEIRPLERATGNAVAGAG